MVYTQNNKLAVNTEHQITQQTNKQIANKYAEYQIAQQNKQANKQTKVTNTQVYLI